MPYSDLTQNVGQPPGIGEIAIYFLIGMGVFLVGFLVIRTIVKKNISSKSTAKILTVQSFTALKEKGAITEEEYKKIKQSLVKQALSQSEETEKAKEEKPITLESLSLDIMVKEERKETPPQEKTTSEQKSQAINIDSLLERGLIDKDEYDRLKSIEQKN